MCTYCMVGDFHFYHSPPWPPQEYPQWPPSVPLPIPSAPIEPWTLPKLKEFEDLLQRVKALEDKLGCPCEPNKADYISLLRKRIEHLEKQAAGIQPKPE